MKRLFLGLLVVALSLALISFFAAPAVAFMGIRSAAEARDIAGLQKLVDFDAVRASLRPQLAVRPVPQTPPPTFWKDPYGALMRQIDPQVLIAPKATNPDLYLSPEGLSALVAGEGRAATLARPASGPRTTKAPMPRPIFWSLHRARLSVPTPPDARTVFTFERRGPFEWKLVHIGLPPAAQPTSATRPSQ